MRRLSSEKSGFRILPGQNMCVFSKTFRLAVGPTLTPVEGVPGLNLLGRDVDYSSRSSTEVRNEWSYTSTPPV